MGDEKALIKVDDLAGLSTPADTLIKKISKAIRGLYLPRQIKRVATAKAVATIIEANANAEVEIIRASTEITVSALQRRAINRLLTEESQKQHNMEAITRKALPDLTEDAKPENIDDDWITNLFNQCRSVSNEQMQSLWARLLAGEANSPGTFSKRTVNTVANFDTFEAILFTKLCSFAFSIGGPTPLILHLEAGIYADANINLTTLSYLETAGLTNLSGPTDYVRTKMPKQAPISYFGRKFVIEFTQPEIQINQMGQSRKAPEQQMYQLHVGYAMFSRVGQELVTISGAQPQEGFVEFVREYWKKYGIKMTEQDT